MNSKTWIFDFINTTYKNIKKNLPSLNDLLGQVIGCL